MVSPRSLRGLDWLNFFVANAQTGFGAFIAAYLTTQAWTQAEIGEVLSFGTVVAMLSQIPGGVLVDRLRDERLSAAVAGVGIMVSAILFAVAPTRFAVGVAETLHSFASSLLTPSLAAISLALVGLSGLGERLGRNARFAALGNGIAAAGLGACGAYISGRAVFWLTALLMVPGILALRSISPNEARTMPALNPAATRGTRPDRRDAVRGVRALLMDTRVLAFAGCVVLFHLSNAAMLPLVGGALTRTTGNKVDLLIAACIILPQLCVAVISPWTGRIADRTGARLVLALGFAALPVRGLLLAMAIDDPALLVAAQTLDGLSAAVFGVMLPLVAAELTRGTERFNACMGVLGLAATCGAALRTLFAGVIADALGARIALLALSGCGMMAVLAVLAAPAPDMPRTRSLSAAGS